MFYVSVREAASNLYKPICSRRTLIYKIHLVATTILYECCVSATVCCCSLPVGSQALHGRMGASVAQAIAKVVQAFEDLVAERGFAPYASVAHTQLCEVVKHGHVELARRLIALGADVGKPDETGDVPLALACYAGAQPPPPHQPSRSPALLRRFPPQPTCPPLPFPRRFAELRRAAPRAQRLARRHLHRLRRRRARRAPNPIDDRRE